MGSFESESAETGEVADAAALSLETSSRVRASGRSGIFERTARWHFGLNVAEGAGSTAGHKRQRYQTALGSAREVQACIDVARATRYIEHVDAALLDHLDHVTATLMRLMHRR